MGYQPIENYGVIGNMHTVALVGMNGSIDWFCMPGFDSPSVFGAILDDTRGGHFRIAPTTAGLNQKQIYWPQTNVLVTRFLSPDGVGEVTDFMPMETDQSQYDHEHNELVRRVNVVRGSMRFRMECFPAFDYGRDTHKVVELADSGAYFVPDYSPTWLQLSANVPLERCLPDYDSPPGEAWWPNLPCAKARPSPLPSATFAKSAATTSRPFPRTKASAFSRTPLPTGAVGCPNAPTGAGGGKSWNAPPWC